MGIPFKDTVISRLVTLEVQVVLRVCGISSRKKRSKPWLTKSFLSKPSYCLPCPTFTCTASLVIPHFLAWWVPVSLFVQLRAGTLWLPLRRLFVDLQAQNFLFWGQPCIQFTLIFCKSNPSWDGCVISVISVCSTIFACLSIFDWFSSGFSSVT